MYIYEPDGKGLKRSGTIPREGHFSTRVDSNLLYSLLPTDDGGGYARAVGKDGWTGFRIKKVCADGRMADWLDLGERVFAKVKRLGPSSWTYALQHDGSGFEDEKLRLAWSDGKTWLFSTPQASPTTSE